MYDLLKSMIDAIRSLGWAKAVGLSLGLGIGSLAIAVFIIVRWPADHFKDGARPRFWADSHPVVRVLGLLAKNVMGYLLTLVGIIMALPGVPGQGLLLVLIGLTLVDFPGKKGLERKLIGRPSVSKVINNLRERFGHPPLILDDAAPVVPGPPPGPAAGPP